MFMCLQWRSRMRQNSLQRNKMATGGKENGLKLWDLEKPESPTFCAKNLRDDWLDLRRPHWVRDMAFIPGTQRVVTCTGYHQVHVFDPSSPMRRPVLEAEYGEYPLTALSLSPDGNTVVVGNTHGQIAMLDLRKGLVRGVLKGLAGGVRSLQCHTTQNVMASCGLDRFLRIHSLDDRKIQHRVYLKSRLNCLLLDSKDMELGGAGGKGTEGGGVKVEGDEEEEEDEVWASMETVTEKSKRKRTEGEKDEDDEKEEQVKKAKKNEGED